ncbi:MAG: hypothetical protein K0S28_2233 [Paucimonas sp.]|jgi:uncharacterized protein|nr:hypothetical protein [Paucimonas sp.]
MRLDQPLSDKEFAELDKFLLSDRCADDGMTMDSLHGYLTALAIGPESVPMAEWLPKVWGSAADGPDFKDNKEAERVTALIARFMNEIMMTFEVAPKEYEPLFCEHEYEGRQLIDGDAWAWGFWEGIQLREEAWQPIRESNLAALLRPIYLLGADEVEEDEAVLADDPIKRHKLAVEMEAAIPHIFKFWQPLRKSGTATVRHEVVKSGRNDLCGCGSGKKFKKCCGAPSTIH